MRKMFVIGAVLAILATACGDVDESIAPTTTTPPGDASEEVPNGVAAPPAESDSDDSDSAEPPPVTTIPEERAAEENELPERVPPASETPATGEADSTLVTSIKQDLISRTGATEPDITVVRSEDVIWNDGSLGCPVPGEMYTQALVNGFWVVLELGGTEYDYRANDRGFFRLCEGFGSPPSNPTG